MSKNEVLRAEITVLKDRLRTARDKEILLLTRLIDLQNRFDALSNHLKENNENHPTVL